MSKKQEPARRIVTGHDENGASVVVSDGWPPQQPSMRGPSVGADFIEMWNVPLAVPRLTSALTTVEVSR